ncbi:alanine/glycine:cation symporter family protein [Pseudokineococcus marinus]|uniref:Alanine:cation symporter family protein n=1 Tax=Pseudokineococcus marinus TaxID=351215 RepID=A0A849C0N1_9ACTN|nr:alanine/glycine:cation symporter family protein [Pseudokineococcus marinus]NNH23248.1 alanine:cation symporter family protein [Pseudokineococcus marinus]
MTGIEDFVNERFTPITEVAQSIIFFTLPFGPGLPLVVVWLIAAGLIFTVVFGVPQIRHIPLALRIVRGKYTRGDEPGEVTHFQALTSAVSGTVGLGNIAGVGVAVAAGGPGATFWMVVAGLISMCTKFVECTLGVKYREIHEDGSVTGGPFRYLRAAFARFGDGVLARGVSKFLVGFFAVAILLFGMGGGNMFQANQTFAQVRNVTGGEDGLFSSSFATLLFGLGLAALVGVVIIGGIKSIGAVTSRLVPAMAVFYVVSCLVVIALNIGQVPEAVGSIFAGAFSPEGVTGGALGALIIGFQRAAFSNEAGVGSAPTAHSAVKTDRPVTEGFVAMLEPFVDTVLICTMTALTIIIANPASYVASREAVAGGGDAIDGVIITSDAFAEVAGWFPYLLVVAVALFAYSTLVTWSYYSLKAWTTLFGRSRTSETIFKVAYLAFTVLGTLLTLGAVLDFADAMLFACAFVNILGLYLLMPVVKQEVRSFLDDIKSGRMKEVENPQSLLHPGESH